MRAIVVIPRCDGDARAARLMAFAVSRGIVAGARPGGPALAGSTGGTRLAGVVAPTEWLDGFPAQGRVGYGATVDARLVVPARADGDEWLIYQNGRWALDISGDVLDAAAGFEGAAVVAITVSRDQRAYREKLQVTGDGRVLGFRRLYRDGFAPAALGPSGPHMLLVRASAAEALAGDGEIEVSFAPLVERCARKGIRVTSISAAGQAWDLAGEEGLLAFHSHAWDRLHPAVHPRDTHEGFVSPYARLEGNVIVERGASVDEGAVIIGPSIIGAGARVERGALVRSAIIAPGASVGAGRAVHNRVVLDSSASEGDSCRGVAAVWQTEERPEPREPYRQWPLFSYARIGKRAVDIIGSVVALAFLATIFPLVAIAIKLNSPGPVFFGHSRQGRRGRPFNCLKFRTMVLDADDTQEVLRAINQVDGPQFKIENDPRVTLVGEFLRATNLDEIPQFFNVLAGRMSIVGPRPSPERENQMCPSWREARLSVRPGITGLWQVCRSAERTNDFQEWIYYDVKYVRTMSLGLDLSIMARTARVIMMGFVRLFTARGCAQGRPDEEAESGIAEGAEVSRFIGRER